MVDMFSVAGKRQLLLAQRVGSRHGGWSAQCWRGLALIDVMDGIMRPAQEIGAKVRALLFRLIYPAGKISAAI
jgi:hypothetical protein